MPVPSPRWRTLITPTLLICILVYAAVLRMDALFKSYGPYEQPQLACGDAACHRSLRRRRR